MLRGEIQREQGQVPAAGCQGRQDWVRGGLGQCRGGGCVLRRGGDDPRPLLRHGPGQVPPGDQEGPQAWRQVLLHGAHHR